MKNVKKIVNTLSIKLRFDVFWHFNLRNHKKITKIYKIQFHFDLFVIWLRFAKNYFYKDLNQSQNQIKIFNIKMKIISRNNK